MSIENTLKQIDLVVWLIKAKNDSGSSFSSKSLYKFEFRFFLCMDIVRFELQIEGKISDKTASALEPLFGFHCLEFYKKDYPEVFRACDELYFSFLQNYNDKLRTDSVKGNLGPDMKKWIAYFEGRISSGLVN